MTTHAEETVEIPETDETDESELVALPRSERDLASWLHEAVIGWCDEYGVEDAIDVQTFEEAGLLTSNRGLVLRSAWREFQITIVRSR